MNSDMKNNIHSTDVTVPKVINGYRKDKVKVMRRDVEPHSSQSISMQFQYPSHSPALLCAVIG